MRKIQFIIMTCTFLVTLSCSKDILDRPPLTQPVDDNFWRNETDVRLYANGFYPNYFVGYNTGWNTDYTPLRAYNFADDFTSKGVQSNFENSIPSSRSSTSESLSMLTQYAGPTWNFAWVRKANIFIDRLNDKARPNLSDEEYNHWLSVARFFRGYEYSRLVSVFGDVPYFDEIVSESDESTMYKDRDNRGEVMDKVYEDFKYVLENMRVNDGSQNLNRYVAASFISRFMLFEGSFQHYHGIDPNRAKKYLEFAKDAAEIVMNSGKWTFGSDFKALFASESLSNNEEVIFYRAYDASLGITHHIGSYSNAYESQSSAANLALIKSFICSDGDVWQNSRLEESADFSISSLIKTRDPRFEATFIDKAHGRSSSMLYSFKFASRDAISYYGSTYPSQWSSNYNTNDAPIMRLAEVVLNWIESKAILAEHYGASAISQTDIDKSINAIRNRPLETAAIEKGVQKTAPLLLTAIPVDPMRDNDVSSLIWEIRRERRMEFVYEHSRLLDLKRWKKIQYMNFDNNPDHYLGLWIDIPKEAPDYLASTYINNLKVKDSNGTVKIYDGNNADEMVGYFMIEDARNRNPFGDEVYCAPVGQAQIIEYQEHGYKLSQTINW